MELPSGDELRKAGRDEVNRWVIVSGPRGNAFAEAARAGAPVQLRIENDISLELTLRLSSIRELDDRPGQYSFVGSRLFPDGQITVVWGHYNSTTWSGELCIQAVDDMYTPRKVFAKTA